MTQQMMDAIECCRQDGGLATAKNVEKLKSYAENEIIAEAVFLNRTTAPNIGLKHKVG